MIWASVNFDFFKVRSPRAQKPENSQFQPTKFSALMSVYANVAAPSPSMYDLRRL